MNWQVFVYPALVVLGILAKALHEKLTRETTEPQITQQVEAALNKFKLDFIRELNETYIRANGSDLTGSEIERRLHRLEGRRA